jgi:hypothetical protein
MTLDLFDDPALDRVLADGLNALAPQIEPVDVVLAELRPRFRRARTRRRVLQASSALAALFLVGGSVALASAPSARRSHVTVESPARHTETSAPSRRASSPARHAPRIKTTPKTLPSRPSVVVPPASSSPLTSGPPQKPVVVAPSPPPSAPPTIPQTTSPPTAAAPAVTTARYWSSGGTIAVRFSRGRMRLVRVSPAGGYRYYVAAEEAQHIDVHFTRNGRRASEIELRVIDGRMVRVQARDTWAWRGVTAASTTFQPRFGLHTFVRSTAGGRAREVASGSIRHMAAKGRSAHDRSVTRTSA